MIENIPIKREIISSLINENIFFICVYLAGVLFLFMAIKFLMKRYKQNRLKNSGIHEIKSMDGFQFENYLAVLFKHQGYKVKVTAARGDYGADLIIGKNNERIAVQAKRHSRPVGIKAVQEIIGATKYYSTDAAWVVATHKFTKQAQELAHKSDVRLVDLEDLKTMILKMNPTAKIIAQNTLREVKPKDIRCSECKGTMTVKKGPYGRFYACNNFPKCKHTKKIG